LARSTVAAVLVAATELFVTAAPVSDRATVLVFISTECPVSNRYAPEIQRIYQKFSPQGVRFWLVYPNPSDTPAIVAKHREMFGYPDIVLRDRGNAFLKAAHPLVTPEVAVFDANRRLAYSGRVDDRFVELMRERSQPTSHDLEQALAAVLAHKPVEPSRTQAVGCFIADMRH
jgi:hypothetical protein